MTTIQMRWYLRDAVNSIFEYFATATGNPILAMPTGTGKSVVQAVFMSEALHWWPQSRFLSLTHVKELVSQNYNRLLAAWPQAPAGVFSAGLNRRDYLQPIIFGGVASVLNSIGMFGHIDILFIDECHLVSPKENTMYQQIITALKRVNPRLKVIGMTATAYRMKQGSLMNVMEDDKSNTIFTDICYDLTKPEDFARLIAEEYLSPLIPLQTQTQIDLEGIKITAGEYNEKQLIERTDRPEVMFKALQELYEVGRDRKRWLVFNAGIENAEHTADILNSWGIPTRAIHSKTNSDDRAKWLTAFHSQQLRCLTNNDVLTTGFDEPGIDLMGVLRATRSASKWVQMLGRGTRPCAWEGKRNCLALDYAGNTMRNGTIDYPRIPGRPLPTGGGDIPVKVCDSCGAFNHISARNCIYCGAPFQFEEKLVARASTQELIGAGIPTVEALAVTGMNCYRHVNKRTGNVTMKVTYHCGLQHYSEYIGIENGSNRAKQWWGQRSTDAMPDTIDRALQLQSSLRMPSYIRVWLNNPTGYPEIMAYDW